MQEAHPENKLPVKSKSCISRVNLWRVREEKEFRCLNKHGTQSARPALKLKFYHLLAIWQKEGPSLYPFTHTHTPTRAHTHAHLHPQLNRFPKTRF